MKTIIFDIDGTLTDMWPIEKSVLLYMTDRKFEKDIEQVKLSGVSDTYKIFLKFSNRKMGKKKYIDFYNQSFSVLLKNGKLPVPEKYPLNKWIFTNKSNYNFVYATGGQQLETRYVLKSFGLLKYFDLENSIDKTTCRFSKKTGIPFKRVKSKFKDCVLISDSKTDCNGARLTKIPFILVKPKQKYFNLSQFTSSAVPNFRNSKTKNS
ncbi:MAG: HAD hydrolase-like protein [bacterium]|nr:HAD hydrolase-like protein [bacterium]